jgi:hypothetical protein
MAIDKSPDRDIANSPNGQICGRMLPAAGIGPAVIHSRCCIVYEVAHVDDAVGEDLRAEAATMDQ